MDNHVDALIQQLQELHGESIINPLDEALQTSLHEALPILEIR